MNSIAPPEREVVDVTAPSEREVVDVTAPPEREVVDVTAPPEREVVGEGEYYFRDKNWGRDFQVHAHIGTIF